MGDGILDLQIMFSTSRWSFHSINATLENLKTLFSLRNTFLSNQG
jgi:hypothetical protein